MTDALWITARSTGVTALVLLTVVMVLGIGARAGRPAFGLPRFAVSLIHRNAALIATALVAIHVTTLLFDPYAQLTLINLAIPFSSTYRPLWIGLGATTLDLLAAIMITSLLRHRLGVRAWRTVHALAYATWPIAWLHGIGSGTDRGTAWYLTTAIACALAVAAAIGWRLHPTFTRRRNHPTPTLHAPVGGTR
jgi:methionine sulfoxide reductase heme-binding subunit